MPADLCAQIVENGFSWNENRERSSFSSTARQRLLLAAWCQVRHRCQLAGS